MRLTRIPLLLILATLASSALAQQDRDAPRRDQARREQPPALLTVSGQGQVVAKPDMATIGIGVVSRERNAREAQAATNARMTTTIDAIKKLGIPPEHIQTRSINLSPIYGERGAGSRQLPPIVGYEARNSISVRVEDLPKIGPVIDAGVASEANQFEGLSFGLRDRDPVSRAALAAAAKEARAKAEVLAEALGLRIVAVHEINEGGVYFPQPRSEVAFARAAADVATPVEAGELAVTANVSIRYRVTEQR